MINSYRHRTFFWISIILFIFSLISIWFFYLYIEKINTLYIKNETLLCIEILKKRQRVENIYIAKAFILREEFKKAIENEDKEVLEKTINIISHLSFYEGGVIVKNKKIIYKTKGAPHIDYPTLIPYSSQYPHKIYTFIDKEKVYGISFFSPAKSQKEMVVLYFKWEDFVDKMFSLVNGLSVSLEKKLPTGVFGKYPLKDINNIPVAYIIFRSSKFNLALKNTLLYLFIFLTIILFLFMVPWIIYILREKIVQEKFAKVLELSPSNSIPFEYGINIALNTLLIHKVYRKALEVAIYTKSVRETLRALCTTFSDIVKSKSWGIILFTPKTENWKFLLWSPDIDIKCLDEVLSFMKDKVSQNIKDIARSKKVAFLTNVKNMENLKDLLCVSEGNIKSAAIIPMVAKDETVGLFILTWDHSKDFNTEEQFIFSEIQKMITDVLENTYSIKDIFWLSLKDPMLGIYNRRILDAMAKNKDNKGILIYLDLDNFKKVNDTYGHDEGDRILKEFTNIIKEVIRKDDILLRYGGDEFILYLKEIDTENAKKIIDRIKEKVRKSFSKYGVTVSSGMTKIENDENIYEKIREAEEEMYMEKRLKHKNR